MNSSVKYLTSRVALSISVTSEHESSSLISCQR